MPVYCIILADLTSPLRLEYLSIPGAALLFVVLALPVIWLGMRSLNWLGAMHRLVLVSEGNATQGDTDGAVRTAASMGIPIDVLPLHYAIRRDVLLDRMIAPAWQRQGEPFGLDLILRSTSIAPVGGTLS